MPNFFPRWTNLLPIQIGIALMMMGSAVTAGLWYYFTPKYTRVGYQPAQPVPFSHKIHAAHPAIHVHGVIEKGVIRHLVNIHPLDRLARIPALTHRRQLRAVLLDVLVAVHARRRRR